MPPDGSLRVLHVSPALFGPGGLVGGGERYAVELARAMAQRTPTTLLSFGAQPREEQLGALRVRVLRNWLPISRFVVDPVNPRIVSALADGDVIHYHQTRTMMATLALFYARAAGRPIFSTWLGGSGIGLHLLADPSRLYTGHLHISAFSRRVARHDRLATARVIYGGVDTDRFSPAADAPAGDAVLFVGRLLPHKGINYLIEAVDADTPLTVIGRRWWRRQPRFYDLIHRLAVGRQVTFVEDCEDDALVAAYRRALCVVLPSVYTDVFGERYVVPELLGQTLLEGMACGRPVICTDVGGMPEVVEDGVTGFVVPPNDPAALRARIRWLRDRPAEAARMGRAGRDRVLRLFTWDRVVDRCLAAYGEPRTL